MTPRNQAKEIRKTLELRLGQLNKAELFELEITNGLKKFQKEDAPKVLRLPRADSFTCQSGYNISPLYLLGNDRSNYYPSIVEYFNFILARCGIRSSEHKWFPKILKDPKIREKMLRSALLEIDASLLCMAYTDEIKRPILIVPGVDYKDPINPITLWESSYCH